MNRTFKLEKGEILFNGNNILIHDDAKKQKFMAFLLIVIPMLYFIEVIIKNIDSGDTFELYSGIIPAVLAFLFSVKILLRSVKQEISLNNVKSMKVKQRFGNKFFDIELKNLRIRRVSGVIEAEELKQYIEQK